jgi:single-strand DNA-binding protein
MTSFNSCTFTGRAGKDPEARYFESGTAVAEFTLAISYPKRKNSEEKPPLWLTVKVWGKQVETITNYVKQGTQMLVQGELEQETWERDGQQKSKFVLNCRNFQLLGQPGGGGSAKSGGAKASSKSKAADPVDDEEIPF